MTRFQHAMGSLQSNQVSHFLSNNNQYLCCSSNVTLTSNAGSSLLSSRSKYNRKGSNSLVKISVGSFSSPMRSRTIDTLFSNGESMAGMRCSIIFAPISHRRNKHLIELSHNTPILTMIPMVYIICFAQALLKIEFSFWHIITPTCIQRGSFQVNVAVLNAYRREALSLRDAVHFVHQRIQRGSFQVNVAVPNADRREALSLREQ